MQEMVSDINEIKRFNFLDETEIAKFTPAEVRNYEDRLKAYRDLKNSIDTAREEGELKEKIEIANNLKSKGFAVEDIAEITGLTKEEVERI